MKEHKKGIRSGALALRSFLITSGMPRNFEELGAKAEDIEKMAWISCHGNENENRRIGGFALLGAGRNLHPHAVSGLPAIVFYGDAELLRKDL